MQLSFIVDDVGRTPSSLPWLGRRPDLEKLSHPLVFVNKTVKPPLEEGRLRGRKLGWVVALPPPWIDSRGSLAKDELNERDLLVGTRRRACAGEPIRMFHFNLPIFSEEPPESSPELTGATGGMLPLCVQGATGTCVQKQNRAVLSSLRGVCECRPGGPSCKGTFTPFLATPPSDVR